MGEQITQVDNYHDLVSAQAGQDIWIYFNGKVEFKYKSDFAITSHFMFNESLLVVLTEEPALLVYDFRLDEGTVFARISGCKIFG